MGKEIDAVPDLIYNNTGMEKQSTPLAEVATRFLAGLASEERTLAQQEVNRFVRWYGSNLPIDKLRSKEVASYLERMDVLSANVSARLEPVRAFLSFAKREGYTQTNLGSLLRPRRTTAKKEPGKRHPAPTHDLTPEGYEKLKSEIATLKSERQVIADEIHRAAADKDFRENAPLDAAKDHQGLVEARIRQLEATLQSAQVATTEANATKVTLGCTVTLTPLPSGKTICYTLVGAHEANPLKGKLSVSSPTGKALLGCKIGDVIKVEAPVGILRYSIETISS